MRRTSEVAKLVGVHPQTIRAWSDTFSRFLSPAASPEKGAIREFNDKDVRVLLTIARESGRRLPPKEVERILKSGDIVEEIPDLPPEGESVPAAEYALAVQQVNVLKLELERLRDLHRRELDVIRGELQHERGKNEQLVTEIRELEREIGRYEAKLEVYQEMKDG